MNNNNGDKNDAKLLGRYYMIRFD